MRILSRHAAWLAITVAFGMVAACDGVESSAAESGAAELIVAADGRTEAVVVVSPEAGLPESKGPDGGPVRGHTPTGTRNNEWLAAADLAKYIGLMSGATPRIAATRAEIDAALKGKGPVFLVGEEALAANAAFAARVRAAAKKKPYLWAEAIGTLREGNRVYLAGTTDWSHAHAVSSLLHRWGCRWYMPTDFGECVPERPRLVLGNLDEVYAPPFEVRHYWLAWNASPEGAEDFRRRNFMSPRNPVPAGHALDTYTKELTPPGKTMFNVPIAEEATAQHVAAKLAAAYAAGKDISLGMEDGIYESDSPADAKLRALQYDKYFMGPSMTDAFMTLYNRVAALLRERAPQSRSRLGFLAYSNITLPPVQVTKAEPSLLCVLAPIDIDPIHGMDDPQSPPRQEYREMVRAWAKVMDGRVVIYDYDQGMLVWRDIPNPSIQGLAQDFAEYRRAGILGVETESRGATGTVFLNLHCRAQLLWNPARELGPLLDEFYVNFYGPAAEPMKRYWTTIHDAWKNTLVTEHEHFVAPAIYTPEVITALRRELQAAEGIVAPLRKKAAATDREKRLLQRMDFMRASFEITDAYLAMVRAAATECDYATAAAAGGRGLAARDRMTDMNPTFTTYNRKGSPVGMPEGGASWWPGEVEQYRSLAALTGGPAGKLIRTLPLEWAFRRDPLDEGLKQGWGTKPPDLAWWREHGATFTSETRKDVPAGHWEMVRTDLYLQAQGLRMPDRQSYAGHGWYAVEVDLPAQEVAGKVHLMFPGLFNECWLYVDGAQVAHREGFKPMWWRNDYRFEWDVDLTGKLRPGRNLITLRIHNPHHFGGMFRRPFLYTPTKK